MTTATLKQIDKSLDMLSLHDQLWLMERLARRIRKRQQPLSFEAQLTAMANDPDIRREMVLIDHEFAVTELDGLLDD